MPHVPSRTHLELRDRAATLLDELSLPPSPDLPTIVNRVAAATNLKIEVEPVGDRDWETVTGLVLVSATSARILIRKSDPRWYQFHVVLHELAHLLFRHPGCHTLPVRHPGRRHAGPGQSVLARGVIRVDFDQDLDFADVPTVIEAEAEKLSQLLSRVVLAPPSSREEAVFG